MLELARKCQIPILQASTSEVYGNATRHPQDEGYTGNVNTVGPRACYNEGKRCAETLCLEYHRQFGINVKVARIFNTYGPRMQANDGRAVPKFMSAALENRDITIHGDGRQTRSFCYVDDMVEGLIRMLNGPGDFTGPVNFGNPNEITIYDLATTIRGMTKSRSKITYGPQRSDDPIRRRPDISLAEELLGWTPKISIVEGLTRTLKNTPWSIAPGR